jgi:histidine ammonia-lyase
MATFAGRGCLTQMAENARRILAVELLAAAQGIEFRRPLRSSGPLEKAHALVRSVAAPWGRDRYFAPDITGVTALVLDGAFEGILERP